MTQLFSFESVNLEGAQNIEMDNVTVTNSSVSFYTFNRVTGLTSEPKQIIFENIVIRDCFIKTRNPTISLGPFITDQQVQIIMRNFTFDNVVFEETSNLIFVRWQSPIPIVIETSTFQNNQNGYIQLSPNTIVAGSLKVEVSLFDINTTINVYALGTNVQC